MKLLEYIGVYKDATWVHFDGAQVKLEHPWVL